MPIIGGRYYSSLASYSPYMADQAERARLSQARQQFEQANSDLVSTLSSLSTNESQGLAQISAQEAIDRMNAEAKQKAADAANQTSDQTDQTSSVNPDNTIPSTINSTFSVTNATRLDGGSEVDLNANTITMKDGTVYDLNTGMKKVDLTV